MSDPSSLALIISGAGVSIGATVSTVGKWIEPAAQEFFKQVLAPITEEAKIASQDFVAARRAKRLERTGLQAAAQLRSAGRTPQSVPDRTLFPILEGAAREDDPALSELWASLLANAADPSSEDVPPSFPAILSQLTPVDARLLDALVSLDGYQTGAPDGGSRYGPSRDELLAALPGVKTDSLEASLDLLVAHGVVDREGSLRKHPKAFFIVGQNEVRLSQLGRRFIAACQPPQ
jgi:hypothetical protein